MLDFLSKNWWVLVVRGVAAVLFGVMTFVWPVITLAVLVLMWGAYALVDGVFAVIGSFKRDAGQAFPWWLFITGLAGVLAGVFTFVNPALTAAALLLLIAAFCIVRGIMQIAAAIRLRDEIDHEWLLGIAGVLSAVFGVMVMVFPGAGAVAIVFWIGALAVAVGVLEIIARHPPQGARRQGGSERGLTRRGRSSVPGLRRHGDEDLRLLRPQAQQQAHDVEVEGRARGRLEQAREFAVVACGADPAPVVHHVHVDALAGRDRPRAPGRGRPRASAGAPARASAARRRSSCASAGSPPSHAPAHLRTWRPKQGPSARRSSPSRRQHSAWSCASDISASRIARRDENGP